MLDWKTIKTEYVTTNTSYRKLAVKYDICISTLKQRATREGWAKNKNDYNARVVSKTCQKVADIQIDVLAEIYTVSDLLLEKIRQVIAVDELRAREWKDLSQGLRIHEDMKRRQFNLMTELERQKLEIERERLAIERAKSWPHDEEDGTTGVIVLAGVLMEE